MRGDLKLILRWQLWTGLVLLTIYFAHWVYRRSSLIAGLTLGYVLITGILVAWNPPLVNALIDLRMRTVAGKSFGLVVLLTFFITHLDRKYISSMLLLFEVLAVVETVLLLTVGYGLWNADSMDASFVAMVYPISLLRNKKHLPLWLHFILVAVPPFMLFAPRVGSTAFVVMVAEVCAYFFITGKGKLVLSIPVIIGVGLYLNGDRFMHHQDRTLQWEMFMQWLYVNNFYWTGTGLGSFQVLGPAIQNKTYDLFVWLHNDFLQVLFEQGIVGLSLAFMLTVQCLKRSMRTPWLFVSSIGTLVCGLTQFPLRFFVGQLFVFLLIRLSLEESYE
jgi:hypothetical protein